MTTHDLGSGAPEAPQAVFEDVAPQSVQPCSFNECSAGHRWPPVVAAVKCAGCAAPLLAVQKTQCPYCNEPVVRTSLRSDFVPRGAGAAKRCLGEPVYGETLDLELMRHEWQEVQSTAPELFEERRCQERSAKDTAV